MIASRVFGGDCTGCEHCEGDCKQLHFHSVISFMCCVRINNTPARSGSQQQTQNFAFCSFCFSLFSFLDSAESHNVLERKEQFNHL
nr:MAG TPA: Divergent 4Fe-4S mono-cluster [Caudoviricetes sp.]